METLQEMLQQIDWDKLLPIFTLILGSILGAIVTFIVTFFKDYLDRKREIGNMKEIIFQELLHNYGLVNQIKSKDPNKSTTGFFYFINCISISVYEAYIDRLNLLTKTEIMEVLSAYRDYYELFNHEERVNDLKRNDRSTFGISLKDLHEPLIGCAETSVDNTKAAILALIPEGGKEFLDDYHRLKEEQESS